MFINLVKSFALARKDNITVQDIVDLIYQELEGKKLSFEEVTLECLSMMRDVLHVDNSVVKEVLFTISPDLLLQKQLERFKTLESQSSTYTLKEGHVKNLSGLDDKARVSAMVVSRYPDWSIKEVILCENKTTKLNLDYLGLKGLKKNALLSKNRKAYIEAQFGSEVTLVECPDKTQFIFQSHRLEEIKPKLSQTLGARIAEEDYLNGVQQAYLWSQMDKLVELIDEVFCCTGILLAEVSAIAQVIPFITGETKNDDATTYISSLQGLLGIEIDHRNPIFDMRFRDSLSRKIDAMRYIVSEPSDSIDMIVLTHLSNDSQTPPSQAAIDAYRCLFFLHMVAQNPDIEKEKHKIPILPRYIFGKNGIVNLEHQSAYMTRISKGDKLSGLDINVLFGERKPTKIECQFVLAFTNAYKQSLAAPKVDRQEKLIRAVFGKGGVFSSEGEILYASLSIMTNHTLPPMKNYTPTDKQVVMRFLQEWKSGEHAQCYKDLIDCIFKENKIDAPPPYPSSSSVSEAQASLMREANAEMEAQQPDEDLLLDGMPLDFVLTFIRGLLDEETPTSRGVGRG